MDGQSLLLNGSMVYPISEPSSCVRRKHWCRMQALVSRCAPSRPQRRGRTRNHGSDLKWEKAALRKVCAW